MNSDELDGNTLRVYTYIVHVDGPVGPRDAMRGAELSSTSVAHYHLQKLETLNLKKNSYGQYILVKKTTIDGHVWVGKNLMPNFIFYSLFF